jgi:hypothetical protein
LAGLLRWLLSLAGGLLGAGLGYGGGWLTEKLMGPKVLEPGKLRRIAALLGGLGGTIPGVALGAVGMHMNSEDGTNPWAAWIQPNKLFASTGPKLGAFEKHLEEEFGQIAVNPDFAKSAEDAGGLYALNIPVDAFNRVLWTDPNTSLPVRASATGLVESASQSRGGADFVSPFDVARIAVGMGSGLVSGMLVGKVLGALAGLTPEAQNTLKQTGMWAGVLTNVLPMAFGR